MTNLVKLTEFNIKTEWDKGDPTNTVVLTDVWVNPDRVTIVKMTDYYVPKQGEDESAPKVLIAFEGESSFTVNESMDDVLQILARIPFTG